MKQNPIEIFRSCGGQLRMSDAIERGISRYALYNLRDRNLIKPVSRGIYRLAELQEISNPDLVTVSLRFPKVVVCLLSALAYYDITTQIPHQITVAILKDSRIPKLSYPPIRAYKFSQREYEAGIVVHHIDGVPVKIYNSEKTIADCFKFRNKIGLDVAIEALKLYRSRKKFDATALMKYAKICRVENVMRPYLEVLL